MQSIEEKLPSFKYDITKLTITGSTQISSKTSLIVKTLQASPSRVADPASKISIIALKAKARYANKLISIVEIAKREFVASSGGAKCFQYNGLGSEVIEIERSSAAATKQPTAGLAGRAAEVDGDADGAESDDAFETMQAPSLQGTKKRTVPVMTVYLSSHSIRELKLAYGEQR